MNNKILKVLNPILFICFVGTAICMVLYKVPGKLQYSEIMGNMHAYFGTAFILLGIIHIYLNWGWVRQNILKRKKK